MEDPLNKSSEPPHDEPPEDLRAGDVEADRQVIEPSPESPTVAPDQPAIPAAREWISPPTGQFSPSIGDVASRHRGVRQNLFLLLLLSLAAFALAAWVFVRVEPPFGIFTSGARDVVRAQLQALDRGELHSAYGMFSAQYRQQVSYDEWNQLIVTHWRMFHAEVLSAGEPARFGPHVLLDIHLRGEDKRKYRARFTLIQLQGRWWVDDLHWSIEPDERGNVRT